VKKFKTYKTVEQSKKRYKCKQDKKRAKLETERTRDDIMFDTMLKAVFTI
jgi:hypothetical protein